GRGWARADGARHAATSSAEAPSERSSVRSLLAGQQDDAGSVALDDAWQNGFRRHASEPLTRLGVASRAAQRAQLVDGGEDQWERADLEAAERDLRRDPDALRRLQVVVGGNLTGRRLDEEEVRVEALRPGRWRDPVRPMQQRSGFERQPLARDDLVEGQ